MDARPLRADARRNRDRLLAVAVRAFSQDGPDVTLEAVAREAGVGIGTLYRHFPTREALVEAAYRTELDRLCDSAPALAAAHPGDVALRAWMDGFLDYASTKRGMAGALNTVIASGGDPYAHTRVRMEQAMSALVAAGVADGTLRADVPPGDVLAGLSATVFGTGDRDQAARLLDLLLDGLSVPRGRKTS